MSANNLTVCPCCVKGFKDEWNRTMLEASEQYGKLAEPEYVSILRRAARLNEGPPADMQERFEIGIASDGTFKIDFWAFCDRCGFDFKCRFERSVFEGSDGAEPATEVRGAQAS